MGVQGLWELLSPVGRPVTLESLENKVLAVDVSIWLNQAIKGIRDKKGESVPNAHLLSIFHKICKLLFYKIKPVFVFDGNVPLLKKQTLLARQTQRHIAAEKAKKTTNSILKNYIIRQFKSQKKPSNAGNGEQDEQHIQNTVSSSSHSTFNDMYCIPLQRANSVSDEVEMKIGNENEEGIDEMYNDYMMRHFQNPSSIDFETEAFNSLPLDVQYELLNTIKETHKRSYLTHKQEMPDEYQNFSCYQMNQLLYRRKIQKRLEEIKKDINSKNTASLDTIYKSYMNLEGSNVEANRVMSEESSHFIFVTQQNKTDNIDQIEIPSLSCSEKTMKREMEHNSNSFPVHSNSEKNIRIEENLSESDITQEHAVAKNYLQNDSNTNIEATYDNMKEKSTGQVLTDTLIASHSSNQIETNDCIQLSVMPSDIPTNSTEISMLHRKVQQKNELCNKNCLLACVLKETTNFAKFQSKERNYVVQENFSTGNQPINICSNILEKGRHGDNPDNTAKNTDDDNSIVITVDLNSQQIDDELFPIDEIERTAENISAERGIETNCSNLLESWDNSSLVEEIEILNKEKQNQERRALTIAEHMYEETKELLKLFGIPYVNSPTEAEAQCATLDILKLTNGTITDDSDIWLFGGQYVYKNFFSKNKYVEFFKHTDIQSHFNLDRSKLIAFAMLTGSDYTQGVQGIGPITAMEILSEFFGDGIKNLQNFKKWWSNFQLHKELPKNDVRAKLSKFHLDDGFPSEIVYDAYLHPIVDESADDFSWGHPDLDQLREQEKFGWDKKKIDDILLPVMKKLNENELQTRIDSFFHIKLKKEEETFSSKRLRKAVKKMHFEITSERINRKKTNAVKRKPKRQRKQKSTNITSFSPKSSKINLSEESSSDN